MQVHKRKKIQKLKSIIHSSIISILALLILDLTGFYIVGGSLDMLEGGLGWAIVSRCEIHKFIDVHLNLKEYNVGAWFIRWSV